MDQTVFLEMKEGRIIAITGGTLFDGTGSPPVKKATVLVEGDNFLDVGRGIDIPGDAEIVEASGKTMIPGLVDAKVHLRINGNPNIRAHARGVVRVSWG